MLIELTCVCPGFWPTGDAHTPTKLVPGQSYWVDDATLPLNPVTGKHICPLSLCPVSDPSFTTRQQFFGSQGLALGALDFIPLPAGSNVGSPRGVALTPAEV